MARRRGLRPEEEELWQAVARSTTPLHAGKTRPFSATAPAKAPGVAEPEQVQPHAPGFGRFRIGEKSQTRPSHDVLPPLREQLASAPIRMDAKAFRNMARGRLIPDARIDLHGMTVAEAHPELIRFILSAQSQGMRLVLVITGKGKPGPDHGPIPQRHGVLKHQVPHWLRMPPLGPAVLQVAEAHLKHGGSGAYYVYLRRAR